MEYLLLGDVIVHRPGALVCGWKQQKGTAQIMSRIEDPSDDHLAVTPPKTWAVGVPAVLSLSGYGW